MPEKGHHPILETRLETLRTRIEGLKGRLFAAKGAERIEEFATVEELENRRAELADRLRRLEREAPEGRQGAGEELEAMADDLTGAIEDLIIRLDARGGHPD
jgi:hypothetical protein